MKIVYYCEAWRHFFRALAANFRAELEARRQRKFKQHWQAAPIGGGGTIQLGYMTEVAALARLQNIKGDDDPIAYVDFERGFIAYGRHPDEKEKR